MSFDDCLTLSDWEKKRRLASVGDVLRKAGVTTWVNRIFGARVPIITFATTEELGEISVDISIRNEEEAGVRAIPLVKQYLTEMQALKPLILAVKAFLSLRDLNDLSQGTLSSYAITLMCINFLQVCASLTLLIPGHSLGVPHLTAKSHWETPEAAKGSLC